MTLDEAIRHIRNCGTLPGLYEQMQLAEWLEELRELRAKRGLLEIQVNWLSERLARFCGNMLDCDKCGLVKVCRGQERGFARRVALEEFFRRK